MKKIVFIVLIFIKVTCFAQSNYADSLKVQLSATTSPLDSFSIIVKLSEINFVIGSGELNEATAIRLLSIAQEFKNDSLLAISYNWIGSYIAFKKGDNTTALEYFFNALPLAVKAKDKRRISSLYFDISLVYFSLQNKEEALNNLRKGDENLPDASSPMHLFMLVQYQRGLSQYYILSRQNDSALYYSQQLSATSLKLNSMSYQYEALYLSGQVYMQMGDMDMADVYFKKAIAMTPLVESSDRRLNFYEIYIPFLFGNGNIHEAGTQASHLMELGLRDNNNNIKLSAAGFLRQVFDSLHKTDSAYYYAKMKDALNDTIFNQNNQNTISALAFKEQLRLIEDTARKTEEERQRKEDIQYVLIALGILTLLILYLLLSRSFITNTKLIEFFGVIALLIVFEFLNLLLHPFLERITHHSPILMLLALVGIAVLLVPMHHKVEKWATTKLVEKNKQIRLAAAKKTIRQLDTNESDKFD